MVNRTRKYMEDLKTVDTDNPGKEGSATFQQKEVKLAELKERIGNFMLDFEQFTDNYPNPNQLTPIDFYFKMLKGADTFLRETQLSSDDYALRFFTRYSGIYVNNVLRQALVNIATSSGAPDSKQMQYRDEMFRRRNELPMANAFRRVFVESYIDNEVYRRFFQNKASGIHSPEDFKGWDTFFNYLAANEYNENGYLRHSDNAPANNAWEAMQNKVASNFYKV